MLNSGFRNVCVCGHFNLGKQFLLIVVLEWQAAPEQGVCDDSERPQVHGFAVRLPLCNFRCNVTCRYSLNTYTFDAYLIVSSIHAQLLQIHLCVHSIHWSVFNYIHKGLSTVNLLGGNDMNAKEGKSFPYSNTHLECRTSLSA